MIRVAGVLLLGFCSAAARGSDLPPGAVARLGDPSFRAGSRVEQIALSPDGKQYATLRRGSPGNGLLAVCDSATGRVLRECELNGELFGGVAWGPGGAHAIATRADPAPKDGHGKVYPDDFRVWDFADPRSAPPPVFPVLPSFHTGPSVLVDRLGRGDKYTDFRFGAAGTRVAARWLSADRTKHVIHCFELKPAETSAKLSRCGVIDLGAEGADEFFMAADGKTVLTFRKLENADPNEHASQYAVTAWGLDGKPAKPAQVRTAWNGRLMPTPDARGLVLFAAEEAEWGFDLLDLGTRTRRALARWKYATPPADGGTPADRGGWAFSPDGQLLAVAVEGKTYVLDVAAGKELGRLEGHCETPTAVAISADGSVVGTADEYGLVRLWNAKGLTPRNDAPGHRAPVQHAELSPDGKRLLTWAWDETVRLWDVASGKELRAFAGAVGFYPSEECRPYPAVATFAPDGTAVLFSTKERLVVRDLLSGLEKPLPGDMKNLGPRFAVFAPDGAAVLTWGQTTRWRFCYEVWDWPSGKKRFAEPDGHEFVWPGFSPDGAAVTFGNDPWRQDAKTGKALPPAWRDDRTHSVHPLLSLRPNPRLLLHHSDSGPRVIAAGGDAPVSRYRVTSSGEPFEGALSGHLGVALSSAGGQYASVWGLDDPDTVQLSEAATCAVRREFGGHRGPVRVLGFTPDGARLLTAGGDHTVLVWDVRLQAVPLPDALKQETNAAKLWDSVVTGKAKDAYLAMARLSREPDAAVKMARLRLKPARDGEPETDAGKVSDARAVELLEAVATPDARALLKELAGGHADAFRTHEAKRALERNAR